MKPTLVAAICLLFGGAVAVPLENNEPQASRAPQPIEGQRPTKSAYGTISRNHTHFVPFGTFPTPPTKSYIKTVPVAISTPKHSKESFPFGKHTIEGIVKKVVEQVYKERKDHPEIRGQPEEKPLLELFGAIYMREAMKKEGDALRDTKKINFYQAELKKKMEQMTHGELKDLADKYHDLYSAESKGHHRTDLKEVVKRGNDDHHHHNGGNHHHHDENVGKDKSKDHKAVVKREDHAEEIDFTIGITLAGGAALPTRRPSSSPSRSCPSCKPHRPTQHSTVVSFPTTLSVPLDIDDQGHVSVIGNKPTEHRHGQPTPTSKHHDNHHSKPTGQHHDDHKSKPTGQHHDDHKSKPTGHHHGHTSKHRHSDPAPTYIPVLVSDHGHISTAFVAVPPKSKHHHDEHHQSKHHSTLPPVISAPRPTGHPGDHHPTPHRPTKTPSALGLSPSCRPLPSTGNLPRPAANDPGAFVNFPLYSEISQSNAKVPGYKAAFINRKSRTDSSRHLLRTLALQRYDPLTCAIMCSKVRECKGFNVFIQRDPSAELSPSCRNPPHQASAHCALFNVGVSSLGRGVAGNFVGLERFQRVYTASNGYDQLPSYANWTGPAAAPGVYRPTSDTLLGQGRGQFLNQQTFPGEIDPAVCINTCDRLNAADRGAAFQNHKFDIKNDTQHGVKGRYRPCNFFNIFQTAATGPTSFTCSFWTSAPNAPKPNLAQKVGGQKVVSSFWYNRRHDDIGKYHKEDLIESGPHDPVIEDRAAQTTPPPRPRE
ncbi:uncharacterized protein J3D65DRAFT_669243 [Phyllosticta citribraziliensis]|uniref:Uncharacterized protein n=1 Tax=Phyllosticta citribraziliensis TaxID=989973 RepID=A0ABR1LIW6_9PEZI